MNLRCTHRPARGEPETRCVTTCPLTLMPRQKEEAALTEIDGLPVTDDVKGRMKHYYHMMVEARQNYELLNFRAVRLMDQVRQELWECVRGRSPPFSAHVTGVCSAQHERCSRGVSRTRRGKSLMRPKGWVGCAHASHVLTGGIKQTLHWVRVWWEKLGRHLATATRRVTHINSQVEVQGTRSWVCGPRPCPQGEGSGYEGPEPCLVPALA